MRARPSIARLGKAFLGERYWAVRLLAMRAEERFRGIPEYARFPARFAQREGKVIQRGPFTGMRFLGRLAGPTALVPMLLGIYEQELHPVIEEEIAREPSLVVDIGCAEGYYAVGLARRLPDTRVVGFEIEPLARHLCRRVANLNGVKVELRAECNTGYLSTLPPGAFVLSDCEGAEKQLLDPEQAPALQAVTMVTEVHDHVDPSISDTLKSRFASSHRIEEIPARPRDPGAYPELATYSAREAELAVSEGRPDGMTWLVLRPLNKRATS